VDSKKPDKDWKIKPPRKDEPMKKTITIQGKAYIYHWCPYHCKWTIHPPSIFLLLCRPLFLATVVLLLPLLLRMPLSTIFSFIGLFNMEYLILTTDYRSLLAMRQKKRQRYTPRSKMRRQIQRYYKLHPQPMLAATYWSFEKL
jgi:hypothetical protein